MAFAFFGGVHPNDHKSLSCDKAIEPFPAPAQVVIPLSQHIGAPCQPLVKVGDPVTRGQKIGDNSGLCVPVHASVSGKVAAIELRPYTGGTNTMCIVLDNDGLNTPCPELVPRDNVDSLSAEELCTIIREAGIAGMGGATFPAYAKISSGLGKVDTVIVNAAECEPYITADDRVLRETPERVLGGLQLLMRVFGLKKAYVGIEANKKEAVKILQEKAGSNVSVVVLRTRYPQGAEKQLIQTITGREVPPGGLPAAVGCAVFNTATTAAIYDAVYEGLPLIQRVVSVTGPAIAQPKNFLAPIGTPYRALIAAAGGFKQKPYKILAGGPMMGLTQFSLDVPVIKGSNSITCLTEEDKCEVENPHCIRCGRCVDACPMHLMPLYMYQYERHDDVDGMISVNLTDCIECGCCAYSCPGRLPLVQSFKTGKQKINAWRAKQKAKEG